MESHPSREKYEINTEIFAYKQATTGKQKMSNSTFAVQQLIAERGAIRKKSAKLKADDMHAISRLSTHHARATSCQSEQTILAEGG